MNLQMLERMRLRKPGFKAPAARQAKFVRLGKKKRFERLAERLCIVREAWVSLSLSLPSFLPPGESPHADPGQGPPIPLLYGGIGHWGHE